MRTRMQCNDPAVRHFSTRLASRWRQQRAAGHRHHHSGPRRIGPAAKCVGGYFRAAPRARRSQVRLRIRTSLARVAPKTDDATYHTLLIAALPRNPRVPASVRACAFCGGRAVRN